MHQLKIQTLVHGVHYCCSFSWAEVLKALSTFEKVDLTVEAMLRPRSPAWPVVKMMPTRMAKRAARTERVIKRGLHRRTGSSASSSPRTFSETLLLTVLKLSSLSVSLTGFAVLTASSSWVTTFARVLLFESKRWMSSAVGVTLPVRSIINFLGDSFPLPCSAPFTVCGRTVFGWSWASMCCTLVVSFIGLSGKITSVAATRAFTTGEFSKETLHFGATWLLLLSVLPLDTERMGKAFCSFLLVALK